MSVRGRSRVAVAGSAVAAILVAVTVGLDVANRHTELADGLLTGGWALGLAGVAFGVPGAYLLLGVPRHWVGTLLVVAGGVLVVSGLANAWLVYATATAPGAAGASTALWFGTRTPQMAGLALAWTLLLFPDGHLPAGKWWRGAGVAAAVASMLVVLVLALVPYDVALDAYGQTRPEEFRGLVDPLRVPLPRSLWLALSHVVPLLMAAVALLALAAFAFRFRGADAERRAQLQWALLALAVAVTWSLVGILLPFTVRNLGTPVVALGVAVALVVAVTRHRLYQIDTLLSYALVYGGLAVLVVIVDGAVLAVGGALGARIGPGTYVAATVVVAAAYGPLHGWLRDRTARLVRGSRSDPYEMVASLARRLEDTDQPDLMLADVAAAVARGFKAPYVRVELDRPDGTTTVASHGMPREPLLVLPFSADSEVIGRLVLTPPAHRLSDRDQELLADMVRQTGAAARAVVLTDALQASRRELVAAREEERRRLRRDLHDGLGPALAALTLKVETARATFPTDVPRAEELLVEVTRDVSTILDDVRRLVHDLRPPALDEVGLVGALEQHAQRFSTHATVEGTQPLRVVVEATGDFRDLPAAVEVAAYRIVSEALTNVIRHSGASQCTVRLERDDTLRVAVHDDGAGIGADALVGVGLTSIRERATELGGVAQVRSDGHGGTTVTAQLPLPSRTEAAR